MNANRKAFLDAIAWAEGTAGKGDNGYNVLFGGGLFHGYTDHPRIRFYEKKDEFIRNGKKDYTTAAGRYQITATTFDRIRKKLGITDFSKESQDRIALELIRERGALVDIDGGRLTVATEKVRRIWASLPDSGYGQPERKLDDLRHVYLDAGGDLNTGELIHG